MGECISCQQQKYRPTNINDEHEDSNSGHDIPKAVNFTNYHDTSTKKHQPSLVLTGSNYMNIKSENDEQKYVNSTNLDLSEHLSILGKDIPQKIQFIVFGFVNQFNTKTNNNIIMPTDLINVIVLYYWTGFFYTDKFGKGIKFINGETVKMTQRNVSFSTCLFGKPINDKMANKYHIDFRINSSTPAFLFGYVVAADCIVNWGNGLGNDENSFSSVGIYVGYERNYFELFDIANDGTKLEGYSKSTFRNKDIFGLEFDFVNDTLYVHHNHYKVVEISLQKRKSVIPAISLMFENDSIDILQETVH
eukprot:468178_1